MLPFLALYAVSILVCWLVARSRRADTRFWLLAGLVAGPFAVPFAFFARPIE